MKKYRVMVPIVAACYVEVEAENEKEAIACALNSEELSLENVEEWEGLEAIVTGNVEPLEWVEDFYEKESRQ